MTRLFLRKNDLTKNEKLPYFTLCVVPEEGEGDPDEGWKEIAAFWKAKSGFGYTGQMTNGVTVDLSKFKPYVKGEKKAEVKEEKPPDQD